MVPSEWKHVIAEAFGNPSKLTIHEMMMEDFKDIGSIELLLKTPPPLKINDRPRSHPPVGAVSGAQTLRLIGRQHASLTTPAAAPRRGSAPTSLSSPAVTAAAAAGWRVRVAASSPGCHYCASSSVIKLMWIEASELEGSKWNGDGVPTRRTGRPPHAPAGREGALVAASASASASAAQASRRAVPPVGRASRREPQPPPPPQQQQQQQQTRQQPPHRLPPRGAAAN
ncbi:atherin-like [Schistocerca americana]|uniref:atherin-like n=1 Tax=Schistocerca americana TaxID=7009 RepID=UPI001F4F8E5E|nr:atherin-like [Schistocerca americana]